MCSTIVESLQKASILLRNLWGAGVSLARMDATCIIAALKNAVQSSCKREISWSDCLRDIACLYPACAVNHLMLVRCLVDINERLLKMLRITRRAETWSFCLLLWVVDASQICLHHWSCCRWLSLTSLDLQLQVLISRQSPDQCWAWLVAEKDLMHRSPCGSWLGQVILDLDASIRSASSLLHGSWCEGFVHLTSSKWQWCISIDNCQHLIVTAWIGCIHLWLCEPFAHCHSHW